MTDTIVEVKGVAKRYRKGREAVAVLSDLDLCVTAGEFLALMGPSGSGKTTLLNLLGGLDHPSAGEVTVCGERIDRLGSAALSAWRARHIGFIFQFYNLMPMLTARANVELPLLLKRMSGRERRRRALTALQVVGLAERAGHYPRELSGGQEQRVAIARAIVSDPELLLADEPTGDLDRDTAEQILELLRVLNTEHGKTIIMVTHDPAAAEHAGRVIHLDKGTLAEAA